MFCLLRAVVIVPSCVLLLVVNSYADSPDQSWTQWRGPQRDGQIAKADWPADLSEERLAEVWSFDQGPSYSGPIVSGDRVYVTETKDRKFEVVRALDRGTGKQIWETQWEGAMRVPFFAASNGSWIRSTPALDGDRLYVAGMRDVLVCLDTKTGKIVWKIDFVEKTDSKLPAFGFVSSPLVLGDHVYVQAGEGLAKLDKKTGKIVWQSLKDGGGMFGSAFSSPTVATIAGEKQLVVQTRSKLTGVRIDDGKVLWSKPIKAFRGMNILTPTIIGDRIFTSSYGGRSKMFEVSRDGDEWDVKEVWNHKSQGYMSSPVVVDGHIYLHLRNQRFVCLDAKTGEERWTTTPFGKYWSMIANGNKLLALDQRGELLLIEASPKEFRLVDKRRVADDSWAHLAIVGDELFVRDLAAIKKFQWRK
ncbi:MAG: PQQ-binding-like beta-propeller repeat protein [Pirellulales bacterium]|nr:PQQ-binding-like beta-propeller repeat protein [Pirellulales bacterium]